MNYINITALIKDGGDKQLQITPEMLGELALSIKKNGSEVVQLKDRSIIIDGILISGKRILERGLLFVEIIRRKEISNYD